jgi:Uma2 family endonuclease
MLSSELKANLPSTAELPCSDDIPVDNVGVSPSRSEDQNFLPNVLLFLLQSLWKERMDWYFGVDMGIYHTTGINLRVPVVPDGFLSLGVERKKGGKSRRSYATWEEKDIVPILTLEMVSHTPGGEYDEKMEIYRRLGVLYYVIYNPEFWQRDRQQPLEIYKLESDSYQLQIGEPYWMEEVGLGIGRVRGTFNGIEQEQLAWFDRHNCRYVSGDERAEREQARAEREQARSEKLAEYLRSIGIDPENLPID